MKATPFQIAAACLVLAALPARAQEPVDIGSRLELFVDDYLIDRRSGDAALHLQKPVPREVVLVTDRPWEGNTCAYYTVFEDGGLYRMYYRGSHYDPETKKAGHPEVTCYAESKDGVHWTRPDLGLFAFQGSKKNNIVWAGSVGTHNFTPFRDGNPDCAPGSRYKALGRGDRGATHGLYAFQSPDGLHWQLMAERPVITRGAFDSQNLAFWDPVAKLYREYHRTFSSGVRDIQTGTSADFLHWTEPAFLEYPNVPKEHLYTNTIRPYPRAPHVLIGFPTRFQPSRGEQTEPLFMTSRDGRTFRRWPEPVIPVTAPEDRDGNRSNYMANGLVQLPGSDGEYSVYATEAYYRGPDSRLRRFTYRVDGFVSVRTGPKGGELVTKPLRFTGTELLLNFVTNRGGAVRVEIQNAGGQPIAGFTLADCRELTGDFLDRAVAWKGGDIGRLAGRPVRLRFRMADADVYSFRFRE